MINGMPYRAVVGQSSPNAKMGWFMFRSWGMKRLDTGKPFVVRRMPQTAPLSSDAIMCSMEGAGRTQMRLCIFQCWIWQSLDWNCLTGKVKYSQFKVEHLVDVRSKTQLYTSHIFWDLAVELCTVHRTTEIGQVERTSQDRLPLEAEKTSPIEWRLVLTKIRP